MGINGKLIASITAGCNYAASTLSTPPDVVTKPETARHPDKVGGGKTRPQVESAAAVADRRVPSVALGPRENTHVIGLQTVIIKRQRLGIERCPGEFAITGDKHAMPISKKYCDTEYYLRRAQWNAAGCPQHSGADVPVSPDQNHCPLPASEAKSEAAREPRALTLTLTDSTKAGFTASLYDWLARHKTFLNERSVNIEVGRSQL